MAIGNVIPAGCEGGPTVQAIGAIAGTIVQCLDDATVTAATATELLNPGLVTASGFHWIKRSATATRAYFFARYTKSATITTDPVIRVVGVFKMPGFTPTDPEENSQAISTNGSWKYVRLDTQSAGTTPTAGGTGITLDLVTSGTGMFVDSASTAKAYSDESSVVDLQDCEYFIVLHSTAASVDTGTVPVFARLIA